ncbi:hypothetical protein BDB01DRAFT_765540 [Pilobolus umbonatus]|nr:hypothetical protein BDB01DRAFT_765540 [Pilobolus umbonatus]
MQSIHDTQAMNTRQRRIRHIRSIAGRNIVWPNEETVTSPVTTQREPAEIQTEHPITTVEDSSLVKQAYKHISSSSSYSKAGLLDIYFTLHSGLDEPCFYKSEIISNTTNPMFRSLPHPFDYWVNWYDVASSILVIRVWARHSLHDSNELETEPVLGYQETETEDFLLLLEWQIDMNALTRLGKSVKYRVIYNCVCLFNRLLFIFEKCSELNYSFPQNTLLFELEDGFYSAAEIRKAILSSQSRRQSGIDMDMQDNMSVLTDDSYSIRKKRSYTYNHIVRLNSLKDCIFDTQTSSDEVRKQIQELIDGEEDGLRISREINYQKNRLCEKKALVIQQNKRMMVQKEKISKMKEQINLQQEILRNCDHRRSSRTADLDENEKVLDNNVKMRQAVYETLNRRKKELIADLFSIYPIEQVNKQIFFYTPHIHTYTHTHKYTHIHTHTHTHTHMHKIYIYTLITLLKKERMITFFLIKIKKSYDDSQQFRIRGIYLPNSVYEGQNDDLIATALGYTAHLVSMLAYYLEIPLKYPTSPMGSRATIRDPVSLINGSRDFPLYAKGVDRYRFEYGVFLLNKNIEQLMNAYGLIVMDLRHTLPNIHYFIQAILTISVTSGPTSMSVLSISSYASGARNTNHVEEQYQPPSSTNQKSKGRNHHTLQPNTSIPIPISPSVSFHSNLHNSPKTSIGYTSSVFINAPQAMSSSTILDTITTSSGQDTTHDNNTIN